MSAIGAGSGESSTAAAARMSLDEAQIHLHGEIASTLFVRSGQIVVQLRRRGSTLDAAVLYVGDASDALLVNKATSAAKLAETFADRAKSWSGSTRAAALRRTQSYYQIALKAHGLMTLAAKPGTAPPSTADLAKMKSAEAHASAAVKTAQANAHSAQIMVGGVAAAGVVGVGYLLLRRT